MTGSASQHRVVFIAQIFRFCRAAAGERLNGQNIAFCVQEGDFAQHKPGLIGGQAHIARRLIGIFVDRSGERHVGRAVIENFGFIFNGTEGIARRIVFRRRKVQPAEDLALIVLRVIRIRPAFAVTGELDGEIAVTDIAVIG